VTPPTTGSGGSSDPTREELEAAHCWEAVDEVPGRPAMTAFRRRVRFHAARWREANGLPIGTQPIRPPPGKPARPVGSRLPLEHAVETGATFVTPAALAAARYRDATKEPRQTFDRRRLWADLLWTPSVAVNLFADHDADVRFDHSPGRLDPEYLGNLSTFDAALYDEGSIRAFHTPYHDAVKAEIPKPRNLARYLEVAERSGVFDMDAVGDGLGRAGRRHPLTVLWLRHLLVLSMLQHPSGRWTSGRLVVVHPEGNVDHAEAAAQYRALLVDDTTFGTSPLAEHLTTDALRARYSSG
jgi:hypothetical protein